MARRSWVERNSDANAKSRLTSSHSGVCQLLLNLADRRGWNVHQQLRQVSLRVERRTDDDPQLMPWRSFFVAVSSLDSTNGGGFRDRSE